LDLSQQITEAQRQFLTRLQKRTSPTLSPPTAAKSPEILPALSYRGGGKKIPGAARIIATTRSLVEMKGGREEGLKRTCSCPFLHSWDFNNVDITGEMYLEGIGNVSRKNWDKKQRIRKRRTISKPKDTINAIKLRDTEPNLSEDSESVSESQLILTNTKSALRKKKKTPPKSQNFN